MLWIMVRQARVGYWQHAHNSATIIYQSVEAAMLPMIMVYLKLCNNNAIDIDGGVDYRGMFPTIR